MAKRSREDFDHPDPTSSWDSLKSAIVPGSSQSSALSTDVHETVKLVHIDHESGEAFKLAEVMRCSLPPHRQTIAFISYEDYEIHYKKAHVNRCIECRKNFPTNHFLDIHQNENHDPLVEVLRDRGERTYSCFVEDCDRKCSTPEKRRMHLIDKHMFPKDYDFYIVDDGIDQRSSMLRSGRHRRRSSAAHHKIGIEDRARRRNSALGNVGGSEQKITEADDSCRGLSESPEDRESEGAACADHDIDRLAGAMSALKFVPTSVRFGRGKGGGRGGLGRS